MPGRQYRSANQIPSRPAPNRHAFLFPSPDSDMRPGSGRLRRRHTPPARPCRQEER
jgi:hypothetical protein